MEIEREVEFTCKHCGKRQEETVSIEIEQDDTRMDFD
jgi:hypothetical protein